MEAALVVIACAAAAAAGAWWLRGRAAAPAGSGRPARDAELGARLDLVCAELDKVSGLVRSLEQARERQYGALTQQITAAGARTAELAETTQALREALASSRARGQWGERMAEDVLRAAGFAEGVSYRKQRAVDGGGVPDFAFLLPEGREVRMDVKFPLDNYLRFLRANSLPEAEPARTAFLRDVRGHVRALARRGYLDPDVTVDCLLLFVPNEQLFAFICDEDPKLLDDALAEKVVLCSPMTLFAVLAVIRQAVEVFQLSRTSDEILAALGTFRTQWNAFSEQLDKVGMHLERVQRAFDALASTRRRQLERQLERVEELRSGTDARLQPLPGQRQAG